MTLNTAPRLWICTLLLPILLGSAASAQQPAAPVDEYAIHADGGIIYDPQHREAAKTGQLTRYNNAATTAQSLKLGGFEASFAVPQIATAYDVIPIRYELNWSGDAKVAFPLGVEAVAFEDEARRQGRSLHDLALPGKIDLDFEYLGSITAHLRPGGRHNIKPDMSDTPKEYPPFDRKPLVRSGVVEAGDLVWFKFRYTNTGNTILDPEGLGGCQFYPQILRKNDKGKYEVAGEPYNLYIRDLEYLYPGESHETWFHFNMRDNKTPQNFGLIPGEYILRVRLVYRRYINDEPFLNIWDGPEAVVWEMPITVAKEAREAPVAPGKKIVSDGNQPDKITRFIHTFEEFMTAFDCHHAAPADGGTKITGTLHLQVAPWTKQVVVKLVGTDPVAVASVAVQIAVDSDSLRLRFDPDPPACLIRDGKRRPLILSQTMADMRTNVQHGPFPEKHIPERMKEMMDCGIVGVSTTSMPWLYDDMHNPAANYQGDSWKYFLDCARRDGMWLEGWGTYPFDRSTIDGIASWIVGKPFNLNQYQTDGYPAVSHADPRVAEANAVAWLYQFHRWGDLYYQLESGEVPISVEDTRGWMRQDVNVRNPIGDLSMKAFQDWLRNKYTTVEAANAAWGTTFASFDQINPETAGGVVNQFGHHWEFTDRTKPFHDWNKAISDFDQFRTEMRVKNYRETLERIRKEIPTAVMCMRTEGANVLVSGIEPTNPNPHMRHIYYSQRRCGAIAEILQKSGVFRFHSDYTTMPYTPSELRELVSAAIRQGIIPSYLPQFDNMRDIAINDRWGTDYQVHYNLPQPKKGYMMHVLTAVYPWFQVMYEEGAVPGILWEDYQCDGFVTETQKRELRFFKAKLNEAISTSEAVASRSKDVKQPPQDWRKNVRAMKSYELRSQETEDGKQKE